MTNSNLTNTQIMLSGQAFFSLRTQATIKPFSSFCDFERVKHAFVSSSLDYCNVLYVEEISQSTLSRLQIVQNAAAGLDRFFSSLHWLHIHYNIDIQYIYKDPIVHFKVFKWPCTILYFRFTTPAQTTSLTRISLLFLAFDTFALLALKLWRFCIQTLELPPSNLF